MADGPKKNLPNLLGGKPRPRPPGQITVFGSGPIARPVALAPAGSNGKLPRAAAVYGCGAAVFAVITLFTLFGGHWITGLILIIPTCSLGGFAYHYLKEGTR